jgi:hypothetical protein
MFIVSHWPDVTHPETFRKWICRIENISVESGYPRLPTQGGHNFDPMVVSRISLPVKMVPAGLHA